MSQEYADYVIACYNLAKEMNQPQDTADMQIQGVVDGKPIYFKVESSYESLLVLMENLKKHIQILPMPINLILMKFRK